MPIPEVPFIFVSYSNKDAGFVHSEIRRFERQGYKVWYDKGELQPARLWAEEIRKAIAACTCFIVFITEDSVDSHHVCDEIDQALRAKKPLIGVYWDNVELPAGLQKLVRSRQTLDRYSMHRAAYEEPLSKTLSEYLPLTVPPHQESQITPKLFPSVPTSDSLAKVVFFALILVGVLSLFLAVVVVLTPNIISAKSPEDIVNNRLIGVVGGLMFLVICLGVSGAAFAVFRVYLRRRND